MPTDTADSKAATPRHLIDDGWPMRPDDEALEPDCNSWWRLDSHPSGKWMIGAKYNRNLFVPIRRSGPRPDPMQHLLGNDLAGASAQQKLAKGTT